MIDAHLLILYLGSRVLSKKDLRVFAEARRVVVADGGGVAETLEQRRRFQDLLGN